MTVHKHTHTHTHTHTHMHEHTYIHEYTHTAQDTKMKGRKLIINMIKEETQTSFSISNNNKYIHR